MKNIVINTKRKISRSRKPIRKQEEVSEQELEEQEEEEQQPSPTDLQKLTRKTHSQGEDSEESEDDGPPVKKIYSDRFILTCDNIESYRIKGIELPKIIFSHHRNNQTIKEKSSVMVYFYTIPKDGYPYKKILEACKKETIKFLIKWLDEKGAVKSEWIFGGARIQGVDFGSAAYERPDISEAAMEIVYQTINVDGIEF